MATTKQQPFSRQNSALSLSAIVDPIQASSTMADAFGLAGGNAAVVNRKKQQTQETTIGGLNSGSGGAQTAEQQMSGIDNITPGQNYGVSGKTAAKLGLSLVTANPISFTLNLANLMSELSTGRDLTTNLAYALGFYGGPELAGNNQYSGQNFGGLNTQTGMGPGYGGYNGEVTGAGGLMGGTGGGGFSQGGGNGNGINAGTGAGPGGGGYGGNVTGAGGINGGGY